MAVCDESSECKGYSDIHAKQSKGACRCSGTSTRPVLTQNLEVVDVLRVPSVKPGAYVVQWRWDAERSDQM